MKLQGSHLFPISPTELWPLITDPASLTAVLPGCQTLTPIAENEYQGRLNIAYGPMAGRYTGNLSLSAVVENDGYTFAFTAQSKTGSIEGNGRLQLQPQDSNSTLLSYEGEAKVGGQLVNHATPLLETTARSLIRQSLENLTRSIQGEALTQVHPAEIQTASLPTDNIFGQQTILAIVALSAIILLILLFFFNRKTDNPS